ncbi:hypothetical protein QFC22_001493 [Naganishia vaughanmartiniae]|uniref:Uncharacterized protein n=1 Tax=Naganishia vaughanmartiniae TaxID=1424756 RepID=A0ACC2XGZ1_9TREE|nr:hypothetical protein QFC22_001493 [Naganishia vaughanmartiniae]
MPDALGFVHLMSKPTQRVATVDGNDFCLQGVCGIWTARNTLPPPNSGATKDSERRSIKSSHPSPTFLSSEFQGTSNTEWNKMPTPLWSHASQPSASPASGRAALDPSAHPDYIRAINAILLDRQVDFVEAGLVSDGLKAPHRRLMLAICGELTGERLDIEIARIGQTQVTKAACIALFNKKTQTAVSMLHNSKDEKHRLMGTLLMQKRIEPASVLHMELSDPYLRAMVKSLAGDTSWGEILYDTDLPLLERIVLAIRFVGDDMLSTFLEEQARRCLEDGSLHGIVLLGLTSDGIQLVQRYLDRTGDIQTAAVIGALIPNKIGNVTRWIETYRDMLDGWKCFKARVRFDMMRGSIARYYGENIKTPKQVLLRCNYCQKDLTGHAATSEITSRTYCTNCTNRLPKCSVCLLQIDTAPAEDESGSTLANALVFCQNCHHGGHQKHIIEWFDGDPEDGEGHAMCPVSGCECECRRL